MSYGPEDFAAEYGLGAAQLEQCKAYAALLLETQEHTNLIGPATIPELWRRHFADSAQLLALGPAEGVWLDLGAGAGFPGLVLAILGARVHLVESRRKKAAFLERVADVLGLTDRVRVSPERIEALKPVAVAAVTARALAPVAQLFDWGLPFAAQSTRWILPKGSQVASELRAAEERFHFGYRLHPSRTAPDSFILLADHVRRRAK